MYLSGLGINKILVELNETETNYAPWGRGRVEYILKNEKYIGDSLWQKSYTPPVLPLKATRNKGEVDQFYVEDTQEAIIDKVTFQKVQSLFEKKAEKMIGRSEPKDRTYKKILYCGVCGNAYKAKHPKDAKRWVCSRSGMEGRNCNTASITESEIERTFVNFYNRLKQNEEIILQKTFSQVTALKKRITVGCESISEIDREIATLSDENSMYIRFFQQSMMDEVTFREQTGVVNQRINELRVRRQKLLHEDDDEACIELLRETREQLAGMPDAILWFSSDIFKSLISKVYVLSKDSLAFELKCGLRFKEKIVWD